MENERPPVVSPSDVQTAQPLIVAPAAIEVDALDQTYNAGASYPEESSIEHQRHRLRLLARWIAAGSAAIALIFGALLLWAHTSDRTASVRSGNYNVVTVPLAGIAALKQTSGNTLRVDGNLKVTQSIIITPVNKPSNPATGQLYYDKAANQLTFYNGQSFVNLGAGGNVTTISNNNATNVTNLTNVLNGNGNGVQLQPATPGAAQTGNFNISGVGVVGSLQTTVITSAGGTLYINPSSATSQQQVGAGTDATLGVTSGSATTGFGGWANELSATKITTNSVGGTAKSIGVVYKGGSGTSHVQVGIYDDDGNVPSRPGSLLASSAIATLTPDGTTTVTVPGITLSANTTYWLAVNTDDNTVARTYNGGNKTSCFRFSNFGSLADPFSGCFFDDNAYSIFLNYTVGGGTSGSLSQASMVVGPTGQVLFQNTTDSSTAFQIQNAAGTATLFSVDTINGRIGIGKTTPIAKLDIAGGDINLSNGHSLKFGALQALSTSADGSITTISNFVSGGKISAQADNFVVQDANATHQNLSIDSSGAAVFSNKTDSTAGFQIQNATNKNVFTLDTTNNLIVLGNDGTAANSLVTGIRGGNTTGNNQSGKNLVISAGNGTGTGGSGDIVFNTASGVSNPLVTLDNTTGVEGNSASGLSWTHVTGSHPDEVLIVTANAQAVSSPAVVTSVTYDGTPLTQLTNLSNVQAQGSVWYLVNPASGSHTITVTYSGNLSGTGAEATTFYNVDQTGPIGGFNTTSVDPANTVSTTLSGTNAGQLVFDALLARQDLGQPTAGTGQTTLYTQRSNNVNAGSTKAGTPGSTTMDWSGSGIGGSINHVVMALNPEPNVTPDPLSEALRVTQSGTLGVSLSATENAIGTISLGGTADRSIVVNQNPGTGNGHSLTVQAGGGAVGNNNGGDLLLQGGAATGTGTAGSVIVRPPSDSANAFQVQNAANSATILSVDTTNKVVTVTNLAITGHIITSGATPAIAAGSAACTTPTVSVSGNDTSGTITVTTGTGCATAGTLATLTFAVAFGAAPHIVLTPGSSAALGLGAYIDDAAVAASNFSIGTNTTPANATTYKWNYLVTQ